ncbi:hypothetical protein MHUMG1_07868 [Metarhizium humberi]|uniref:Quercetin 2,3-dioxygenase n=1 Tax=Metarhizium humberi TaxID=2596975 RepID=A0A9P8M686_9HYPO|nr:hypothetical protein MHUMG1_07868 [Metarhizium humberi]
MGFTRFLIFALAAATAESSCSSTGKDQSIIVHEAPQTIRPYVMPKYKGRAVLLSKTEVVRFAITANSSDGAFSMIQHNGKLTGYASARFHTHRHVHEHVYCARGRVELWAQKNTTDSIQEARVATLGDYGNLPIGSIHTFQLIDPDTQLTHIFHPAGFEHLFDFYSVGDFESMGVGSPYVPHIEDEAPFGPLTPELKTELASLDLYESEQFVPRRDLINGTAGDSKLNWHNGPNELPTTYGEPYFIAKDHGKKFLNTETGYKIIQPLTNEATEKNFTLGTVIMSQKLANESATTTTLPHHFALQMEDGQLILKVEGYESTAMLHGDVAFIPAGTKFSYHAAVPFTKFLYMNDGYEGLDHQLLENAMPWELPAYPPYAGFKAKA